MYAIEFKATIRNGMIPIPKQYLRKLQSDLRVIVMQEDPVATNMKLVKRNDFFSSVAQHRFDLPQDYSFKREDLYDRT